MGSSLELLALPARIVPAARLSDEEFVAFCQANEPYQFEMNERGEIVMMTPMGGEGGNLEGYVFRELDLWVEAAATAIRSMQVSVFVCPTGRGACQTRLGSVWRSGIASAETRSASFLRFVQTLSWGFDPRVTGPRLWSGRWEFGWRTARNLLG